MLIALCGPVVFFAGLTVKTNLVACLLALGIFAGTSYLSRPRAAGLFVAVLALGVAALERNNLALIVIGLAALSVLKAGRAHGARGLTRPGFAIAAAGTLVLVLAAWDMRQVEQRAFSPVGLNFYVGNAPGSWGGYTKVPGVRDDLIGHHTDAVTVAEKARGQSLTRWDVSRYWSGRSLSYYLQHPGEYAVLQLRMLGLFFAQAAQGDPEQYRVWRRKRPALWLAVADVGGVLALSVVGLYLLGRGTREGPVCFLLFSAALYSLSVWLFFINERYRVSLVILLAPFAGYGLARIIDAPSWRRRVVLMMATGALWVGAYALTGLLRPGSGWAVDLEQAVRDERQRLGRELPV